MTNYHKGKGLKQLPINSHGSISQSGLAPLVSALDPKRTLSAVSAHCLSESASKLIQVLVVIELRCQVFAGCQLGPPSAPRGFSSVLAPRPLHLRLAIVHSVLMPGISLNSPSALLPDCHPLLLLKAL